MAALFVRQYNYKRQGGVAMDSDKLSLSAWPKWVTLFVTSSTLLCCTLPIILVSVGLGATVASLNYNIPGLVFMAENKVWTLVFSAFLLVFLAWLIWRPNQTCPADLKLAASCKKAKTWNKRIFTVSVFIWCIGIFFSFLLLPLRQFFNF